MSSRRLHPNKYLFSDSQLKKKLLANQLKICVEYLWTVDWLAVIFHDEMCISLINDAKINKLQIYLSMHSLCVSVSQEK